MFSKKTSNSKLKNQSNFFIEGYNTIEVNSGRGVCILHKENIETCEIPEINKIYSPSLFLNVKSNNSNVNLGIIYRSPNATAEEDDIVNKQIEQASKSLRNLIIVGDFNHPEINWEHSYTKMKEQHRASKFLFNISKCKLHQHVDKPTHHKPGCKPSLIDLVITKDPDIIENITLSSPLGKSFHSTIFIKTAIKKEIKEKCMIKKYQIDKGNYDKMREQLGATNWEEMLKEANDDVDKAWNDITKEIIDAREKYIPSKLVNTNSTKRKYTLEDSLIHLTRVKRLQYKLYKKYPSQKNYLLYVDARSKVSNYTRNIKRKKEKNIAKDIKSNPKAFYQYISSKTSKKDKISDLEKPDGEITSNDQEKSEVLNNFFTSVFTDEDLNNIPDLDIKKDIQEKSSSAEVTTEEMKKLLEQLKAGKSPGPDQLHPRILKECAKELALPLKLLFDLTMQKGRIPKDWKSAEIKAIYKKKGKKSNPSNYRPVSLTSVVSKLMEKIIKSKLNNHLKTNKLLAKEQYGFVSGRSTDTQLLTSLLNWQKALDEDVPVDVVYMDFKKAFDSVPHIRLVKKLKTYGIEGNLLSWIEDFLSERFQHVKVNNSESQEMPVTSGVPQGSVLGPTLFIFFINDLPSISTVQTKIFADDTKAYSRIENQQDQENLQQTIDLMHDWTEKWQLHFNETKCKILHLGHNNQKFNYFIGKDSNRIKLEETTLEKDLGVHVDKDLTFEQHIDKITKKAASKCARILKNFTYRSQDVLVPIFKTIVRPILEYANSAWSSGLRKNINEIEKIQKSYTKHIFQVKHLGYEQRLEKLKLPSLEYRRFRGDLIQTFKIARNLYDEETVDTLFTFKNDDRLRGHRYKITKFYFNKLQFKHFFTNRVSNHWNNLPSHIVEADSLNIFKNKIDNHFKDKMYTVNFSE